MLRVELYIENQRVDLFQDEMIQVISSVQNIKDISKTFNDFSQSFTVPSSPRNDAIFTYWYNCWVDGFDARIRHTAYINIDGVPFRTGSVRLEGAKEEKGKPVHYKVTFFGQLIGLKDTLGDALLSDLDLSAYEFDFSYANVRTGLISGLVSGAIVFPLISTKRQWEYDSDSGNTTYTDTLTNIADNGAGNHGVEWSSLRPAINVMSIIAAIENDFEISFSRDFLSTTAEPLAGLRLWLANKDGDDSLNRYFKIINYYPITTNDPNYGTFNNSKGSYTPNANGATFINDIDISTDSSDGVQYTLQLMAGNQVLGESTSTGYAQVLHSGPVTAGVELYARIITQADKTITDADFVLDSTNPFVGEMLNVTKDLFIISSNTLKPSTFIPSIKIIDFLKGICNLYNLVIIPTSATEFTLKTLDTWYEEGEIHDISEFEGRSDTEIERPEIYREISFMFEDPDTLLAKEFAETNPTPYGDLGTKILASDGSNLDGDEFEIEVPFEQMVYERLNDLDDDTATNIVYGLSLDSSLSRTFPKAHLLYTRQINISTNPIYLVDETGTANTVDTTAYMPSHVESSSKLYSTTFGAEIDEHSNTTIQNSLFYNFYRDYITDIFSVNRRLYKLTAKLPVWLLHILKLNDKLIIGTDRYIINSMTTEVNSGMVNFELLNDIYNLAETTVIEDQEQEETPEPPPATTGQSFSISGSGGETQLGGCAQTPNATKYAGTVPPNLGTFIYNEIGLTTYYDGGDQYYKIAGGKVIRINSGGIVTDVFTCP